MTPEPGEERLASGCRARAPRKRRRCGPKARWTPVCTMCTPHSSSATEPARSISVRVASIAPLPCRGRTCRERVKIVRSAGDSRVNSRRAGPMANQMKLLLLRRAARSIGSPRRTGPRRQSRNKIPRVRFRCARAAALCTAHRKPRCNGARDRRRRSRRSSEPRRGLAACFRRNRTRPTRPTQAAGRREGRSRRAAARMARKIREAVDLRLEPGQPLVLAEDDRGVTSPQLAGERRLAGSGLAADEIERRHPRTPRAATPSAGRHGCCASRAR